MATAPALTTWEVIERAREARADEHDAAVRQVELAVEWAHLHPCPVGGVPAHWGDLTLAAEALVPLAGKGAPLVAEFAPAELAAALGIGLTAGRRLMSESIELVHRLPRLWAAGKAGELPVWRLRAIAGLTTDLGPAAVDYADRLLAATPSRITSVQAARLVDEARLYFDPDRAAEDQRRALEERGVRLTPGNTPAVTSVAMLLDSRDARLLDQTLDRVAHELRVLGDDDSHDVRRSRAVGVLADPQYALDLLSGREASPTPSALPKLYLHVTPQDLEPEGQTFGQVERLGAVTSQLLRDWLAEAIRAGGPLRIRPVLDLSADEGVDRHDPPEAMRELVVLRDAHCVFPACHRDSRGCDLDHVTEYLPLIDGGPPSQTRPSNLAPLCRTHHRVKTFTAWSYKRADDHGYTWTSPTGHQYAVHPASRRPPRP